MPSRSAGPTGPWPVPGISGRLPVIFSWTGLFLDKGFECRSLRAVALYLLLVPLGGGGGVACTPLGCRRCLGVKSKRRACKV